MWLDGQGCGSVVSAKKVVACGWMDGVVVVSVAWRHSVIEGILTCVIVRHRRNSNLCDSET